MNQSFQKNNTFSYTYSSSQEQEIRAIRSKYLPPEEDGMTRLRRLDRRAAQKAACLSMTLGVVSALILGTGMSCCMVWGGALFLPGILIGLLGLAGVAAAYPVHAHTLKKERERIAPEILRLSDELLRK